MSNRSVIVSEAFSERKIPANIQSQDIEIFSHELARRIPKIELVNLRDVFVNSDGLLDGLAGGISSFAIQSRRTKLRKSIKKYLSVLKTFFTGKVVEEDVMWVADSWNDNYFHWMTEGLMRVLLIRKFHGCSTLLAPQTDNQLLINTVKLLGVNKIISINKNEVIKCKSLVAVDTDLLPGNYNDSCIRELRDVFLQHYAGSVPDNPTGRLYISRGKAGKRKVVNEIEVISLLKEYGFQIVCMEDYPFEEQIKLSMSAKYLVSNHGAGLTNMIFMKDGGSVFELRKVGDSHDNCYFSLSSALALRYYYQLCAFEGPKRKDNAANIIVDIELFKESLLLMLA